MLGVVSDLVLRWRGFGVDVLLLSVNGNFKIQPGSMVCAAK
jgi:hypothetical protein